MRNVLKKKRRFFLNWLNQFIRLCFQEQQLGHFALFGLVLTHPDSESYTVAFLGSLLCEECFEIFLGFLSTRSTGWETRSAGSLGFFFSRDCS